MTRAASAATTTVVELIGSRYAGSRTRQLADAAVDELAAAGTVALRERHVLDLAELAGITFDSRAALGCAPIDDAAARLGTGDLLAVATPVYKAGYSGVLKAFLDPLPRRALAGTVAVTIVTAADEEHSLAVAQALTTVLTEMGATLPAAPLTMLDPEAIAPYVTAWANRYGTTIRHALASFGDRPTRAPQRRRRTSA